MCVKLVVIITYFNFEVALHPSKPLFSIFSIKVCFCIEDNRRILTLKTFTFELSENWSEFFEDTKIEFQLEAAFYYGTDFAIAMMELILNYTQVYWKLLYHCRSAVKIMNILVFNKNCYSQTGGKYFTKVKNKIFDVILRQINKGSLIFIFLKIPHYHIEKSRILESPFVL